MPEFALLSFRTTRALIVRAALLSLCVLPAACIDDDDPAHYAASGGAAGESGSGGAGGDAGTGGDAGMGGDAGTAGTASAYPLPTSPYDGLDCDGVETWKTGEVIGAFTVRQTVEQLHVWHVDPDTAVTVTLPDGGTLVRTADAQGAFVFRELAPGEGYSVSASVAGRVEEITGLKVWTVEESQPGDCFYARQKLVPGYQYLRTRDGTTLSVYVTLPGPIEKGPYPTIVNYSGYRPSKPGTVLDQALCDSVGAGYPTLCDNPNHPSGMLGGIMGYATVGVNMRGSACSGGAYDYFETMQLLDGYDIIEIVGAQDWVKFHRPGMAGLSYPGISQLFVAQTQPPSLAAITPLSVLASIDDSVMGPGGIYNDGFAFSWTDAVLRGAQPYGKGWERGLVDAGDTICEENQILHGQQVDLVVKALANPWYTPELYDHYTPEKFAHKIEVPVFLSGQWQDEQTGGHFPALFNAFTGTDVVRFTAMNGVHADGYTPHVVTEWKTFLDFYVARKVPRKDVVIWALSGDFFQDFFGAPLMLPEVRFEGMTDYDEARALYESEPRGRLAFEVGANVPEYPGAPEPRFSVEFESWPVEGTTPERWYFQPDGGLSKSPPVEVEADVANVASSFEFDFALGATTSLHSGDINKTQPPFQWLAPETDKAVVFETAPFDELVVMAGPVSADLWIQSTAPDADLEVSLIEVREDGHEVYVQSGWLRATYRALRDTQTELRPTHSRLEAEALDLPAGEWTSSRVEVFPLAHIFRAGSRLRVVVSTPGGNRASWSFILKALPEGTRHAVAHHAEHPSSILLPVVPAYADLVPEALRSQEHAPACTVRESDTAYYDSALRGQPCRVHAPFTNTEWAPEIVD